jgi:AraC family transcriptional regulator
MDIPKITIGEEIRLNVIYLRFRGSYIEFRKQSGIMYQRLLDYAKKNNLYCEENTKVMTIYHDNPFITKSKDLRTSVAMSIPSEIVHVEDDEISLMTIAGKFAIGHFELKLTEYGKAWQYIYHDWLFKSDVKPRDSFPFEMYVTKPPSNYKDKSLTNIYIPIE